MTLRRTVRRFIQSLMGKTTSGSRVRPQILALEDRVTPSVADWAEPNETRQSAVYLGRTDLNWSGLSIHTSTDQDWYAFRIDAVGQTGNKVGITAATTGYDLDIELYDSVGTLITGSYSSSGTESISMASRPAGLYYLKVNGFGGATGDYSFQLDGPTPADTGDFLEFNDVPNNGFTIPARSGGFNMFGMNIHTTTDKDWYYLRLANVGTASDYVQIDFTHANGDLDMQLYTDTNTTTAIRSSGSTTNQEKISLSGLAAGNYYLQVYGFNGAKNTSGYGMTLNLPQPGGTSASGDWAEVNDTTATATNLGTLTSTTTKNSLSIHTTTDKDYFKFQVPASGSTANYVQINFSHAEGDLDMQLLDSAGATIGSSGGVSDSEKIALTGLVPGKDYYVYVYGYSGAKSSNYSLTISPPEALSPDAKEVNNTISLSTDLGLSSTILSAGINALSIHNTTDVDYFKVNLIATGTANNYGRISFSNAQGNLEMGLYNSVGTLLKSSTGANDSEQISFEGLGAGVYYLGVYGLNGATNPNYTLTVLGPSAPVVTGDRFEVNDSVATATDMGTVRGTPPATASLSIHTKTDLDFYAFTLAGAGQTGHQVQIGFDHSKGDLDMRLRDSAGNLIAGRTSGGVTNTETISLAGLAAGKYYVEVYGYSGAINNSYSLSFVAPQSGWQPDRLEANNTTATASQLRSSTGSETSLTIHNSTDVDLFKLVTTELSSANHFGRITFNSADGNLDIALLDSNGNVLVNGIQATNAETVNLSGRPAGTYYLRVSGASGATNQYDLTWSAPMGVVTTPTDAWTIMVYMNSSNLPSKADINEMEQALAGTNGLPASVNIVVYLDQNASPTKSAYASFPTGNGTQAAWGTAGYGVVVADTGTNIATTFTLIGERNTGSPATLTEFLQWGKQNAPAQKYSLILWDHGGGVRFGTNVDDEGGGATSVDSLSVNEIRTGIQNSGVSISLLAMDMCLMGMAEVAFALRDVSPIIVASEELISGPGFDYANCFSVLRTNPASVTAEQLASSLVSSFQTQYVRPGNNLDTLAAVRSSQLGNLSTAMLNFVNAVGTAPSAATLTALRAARDASAMYGEDAFYGYRDLGQFMTRIAGNTAIPQAIRTAAQAVNTAIGNAVFSRTQDRRGSSGLAVYLPSADQTYDSRYSSTAMGSIFTSATLWNQVANLIAGGTAGRSAFSSSQDIYESNDSAALASDLNTLNGAGNEISNLNLHSGDDQDYFRFTTVASGTLTVQAIGQAGESLQLQLLTTTESSLGSNTGATPSVTTSVTSNTTYLVRVVSGDGNISSGYSLIINAPENRNVSGAAGVNDSRERAFNLGVVSGREMFTGYILANANQNDWFTFETPRLTSPNEVQMRVLFSSSQPVTVFLEDSNQTLVGQVSGLSDLTIPFVMDAGQNYNIRVTTADNQVVPYSLSFRSTEVSNTNPGISSINDATISLGQSFGPLAFTVNDLETPGNLSILVSSSNLSLIPIEAVNIQGTGTARTITVTPTSGQLGSSLITLTVVDPDGAARTESFLLSVTESTSPPPVVPPVVPPGTVPPVTVPPVVTSRDNLIGTRQFAVGSDEGSSLIRFFSPTRTELLSVDPFGGFTGGVRTATADFNRDGIGDIVAGTGPGGASKLVVIDGATGNTIFSMAPFEAAFVGGVYVAAGDITGDGIPEFVITPDEGGGPRARIFTFSGGSFSQIGDFFGIEDPNFRGGARAAIGDFTGDGKGELLIGAGFGGGPRIAIWNGASLVDGKMTTKPVPDFFAFETALRNGSFLTVGDVTGDGIADLIFGGGPGGAPRVRVFDGAALAKAGSFSNLDEVSNQAQIANFFAGDVNNRGGIRLSIKDLDNDTQGDLVTGAGEGDGNRVIGYFGKNLRSGSADFEYDAIPGFEGGVFVG